MEILKEGELYEIEGKIYKLCKSEFEHCTHGSKIKKFYFKKPTYEDGCKEARQDAPEEK